MNIIRNSIAAMAALVLSLGFALPAAALDAYGNVDSSTQGSVQVGTTGADANVGVNVGVGGSASGATSGGGSSATTNTDANASAELDVTPLLITRADIDANAVESTTVSVFSVRTGADLQGYVAAQMKSDTNVSVVESASDRVAVTYKQHAKLFGFIPVTLDATAVVDANGNVSVKYPWYAFLTTNSKADLQTKIEDRVNADANVQASANASAKANAVAKLTAAEQAKIVAAVKAAMQAQLNADASARVNKVDSFTVKQ